MGNRGSELYIDSEGSVVSPAQTCRMCYLSSLLWRFVNISDLWHSNIVRVLRQRIKRDGNVTARFMSVTPAQLVAKRR